MSEDEGKGFASAIRQDFRDATRRRCCRRNCSVGLHRLSASRWRESVQFDGSLLDEPFSGPLYQREMPVTALIWLVYWRILNKGARWRREWDSKPRRLLRYDRGISPLSLLDRIMGSPGEAECLHDGHVERALTDAALIKKEDSAPMVLRVFSLLAPGCHEPMGGNVLDYSSKTKLRERLNVP
jgi:hypothetical protein